MEISSRTPEGSPGQCPLCGAVVRLEPSEPHGDAPCPACGSLLWFSKAPSGVWFYDAAIIARLRQRVISLASEHFAIKHDTADDWSVFRKETGADSLDLVELVLELEAEFPGLTIPDEDAQRIHTVGDLLAYLLSRLR
jgi:acyl carrier protein